MGINYIPLILDDFQGVSLPQFFQLLGKSPLIVITVLLALGVVFINGWTDAPNAVATCISTRAIAPKKAIIMAAIFNFIGVMLFSLFAAGVAESIAGIVDFGSLTESVDVTASQVQTNAHNALIGLSAGMIGVVAWGVLAWIFGMPSSESHALVAGLTGACFAMMVLGYQVSPGAGAWSSVGIGFVVSAVLGLVLGFLITKLIEYLCKKLIRGKTTKFFKWAQIISAAGMALAHGAQDGLKFVGVIYLVLFLGTKAFGSDITVLADPNGANFVMNFLTAPEFLWLPVLVSIVMGLGTSIGGYRIIKKVGMGMVDLEPYQGFATDISAFIALMVSSLLGWPVSTSQVKTCSIIGVGLTKGAKKVNWRVAIDMVLTWVFTFPGCILIGFLMTLLFFAIPGL
ncbi:MAG: inorganic phosphate transporter [Bacilli bacterium]|jgi:PiT family inorganic phosphate transporter